MANPGSSPTEPAFDTELLHKFALEYGRPARQAGRKRTFFGSSLGPRITLTQYIFPRDATMTLTIYPYLIDPIWVFDDERTGLKEEVFVCGASDMISCVV